MGAARRRPAAIDALDEGMPPINITGVPKTASDQDPAQYYFGTVMHFSEDNLPAGVSPAISSPFLRTPSQGLSQGFSSAFGDRQSAQTASGVLFGGTTGTQGTASSALATLRTADGTQGSQASQPSSSCPFEDVKLGHLLGRGSFGSVYFGRWNNRKVAVKVRG